MTTKPKAAEQAKVETDATDEFAAAAETPAAPAKESRKEGLWGVKDTNARQGPRKHEPIEGYFVDLYADKFTYMPEMYALRFLRDPSFIVVNEDGDPEQPLPDQAKRDYGRDRPVVLAAEETVAKFEELTKSALLARAMQFPGGEAFTKQTSEKKLVEFLIQANQPPEGSDLRSDRLAGVDEMGPDELDRMFASR